MLPLGVPAVTAFVITGELKQTRGSFQISTMYCNDNQKKHKDEAKRSFLHLLAYPKS